MSHTLVETLSRTSSSGEVSDMIGLEIIGLESGDVAVVTLSRPEHHNALNLVGWQRIARIFEDLERNGSVRVVIVRGAGTVAFGAGADISEFPTKRLGAAAAAEYNAAISSALQAVQRLPVPVIAMIGGLAVGGGCELAAACDVRIASLESRFGIPIGKLGVTLGLTETRAVVGLIGAANLKYLVYGGELIDATSALAWGLVQDVVGAGELADAVAKLAINISRSSEVTVRATKQITALAQVPAVTEHHELIKKITWEAYNGDDLREGVAAFLNKRTPKFTTRRRA